MSLLLGNTHKSAYIQTELYFYTLKIFKQIYQVLNKVKMENRSNKYEVRVLEINMGQGGAGIRVLVQCCTECNTMPRLVPTLSVPENGDPPWVYVHSADTHRCTRIPKEVHSVNTGHPLAVDSLLDSGATGMFINVEYVRTQKL